MKYWFLRYRLWRLGRHALPDSLFKRELRRELQTRGFLPVAQPLIGKRWRMALASTTACGTLFAGTVGYAWASDDVLPDHALYPIREEVERVELALARTPEKKQDIRLQHLERRVHEIKLMQQKKRPVAPQHVDRLLLEMKAALPQAVNRIDLANEVEDEETQAIRLEAQSADEVVQTRQAVKTEEEREALDEILTTKAERVRSRVIQLKQTRRERPALKRGIIVPPVVTSTSLILSPASSTRPVIKREVLEKAKLEKKSPEKNASPKRPPEKAFKKKSVR